MRQLHLRPETLSASWPQAVGACLGMPRVDLAAKVALQHQDLGRAGGLAAILGSLVAGQRFRGSPRRVLRKLTVADDKPSTQEPTRARRIQR